MIAIKKSQGTKKKSDQKNPRQDAIIRKIKAAVDAGKSLKKKHLKSLLS